MSGNSRGSRRRSRRSGGAYGKKARENRRNYDKLGIDPLREVTDDSGLKAALYSLRGGTLKGVPVYSSYAASKFHNSMASCTAGTTC